MMEENEEVDDSNGQQIHEALMNLLDPEKLKNISSEVKEKTGGTINICIPTKESELNTMYFIINADKILSPFLISELMTYLQASINYKNIIIRPKNLYSQQTFNQTFKETIKLDIVHQTELKNSFEKNYGKPQLPPIKEKEVKLTARMPEDKQESFIRAIKAFAELSEVEIEIEKITPDSGLTQIARESLFFKS